MSRPVGTTRVVDRAQLALRLLVVNLVLSHLFAAFHFAATEHSYCADHGQIEHAEVGDSGDDHHGHDDPQDSEHHTCSFVLGAPVYDRPAVDGNVTVESAPSVVRLLSVEAPPAPSTSDRIRVAPKTSPPSLA